MIKDRTLETAEIEPKLRVLSAIQFIPHIKSANDIIAVGVIRHLRL